MTTAGASLELRGVAKHFGGVRAVDGVDLVVPAGSATAVIGPNGAGKSTILKMVSGAHRPSRGEILVDGERIDALSPHVLARRGIGLAHQIPRPFHDLTVRQNVSVAASSSRRGADVDQILAHTDLARHADRPASSLGVLDLKRIEVARALACVPRLILLDEIAAGLVGRELDEAIELVRSIHATGVTLLLVEHVEAVVRSIADQVAVMNWGSMIALGSPEQIAADPQVREVYLGDPSTGDKPSAPAAPRHSGTDTSSLLSLSSLSAGYGRQAALHEVDLEIRAGEVVAVLGANGAGKSTLCAVISGLLPARSGTVLLTGKDITTMPAHLRNRGGISHCPEGRRLFAELTVGENLELGAPVGLSAGERHERLAKMLEVFPQVEGKLKAMAGSLSGGQQQMVAVVRALMSEPRLLICDEVSLGLAPKVIDELYDGLRKVRESGASILLVEQNVARCLEFADHAYVLNRGAISFSGDPRHLGDEDALDQAYFGHQPDATSAHQKGGA